MPGSGTLGNTLQALEGPATNPHPVTVFLRNGGGSTETVSLALTPSGAITRTVIQVPLGPGEHLLWSGIPLSPNDTISGQSMPDAGIVSWVSSALPVTWTGPMNLQVFDTAGRVKTAPGTSGTTNLGAATDPINTNDSTQGFAVGSLWINSLLGKIWFCTSATPGAAIWYWINQGSGVKLQTSGLSNSPIPQGMLTGALTNICEFTANAPGVLTTRTATQLYGDAPASLGVPTVVRIVNSGRLGLTLVGGSGVQVMGPVLVAPGQWQDYLLTFTSPTSAVLAPTAGGTSSQELVSVPKNL